jgi:small subunit ribosomal protein S18
VARQQRQQTPTGRGRRRGLTDRGRPRKYTQLKIDQIDYKDVNLLRRFISDRGKTRSRRVTGLSRKHQQQLTLAVKRARELALLPYVGER